MIMIILAIYGAILCVLEKMGLISWNRLWTASFFVIWAVLQLFLLIPMGWTSPEGSAIVLRNTVPIVPNVAGEVIEIVASPNEPLTSGSVLFRIDPVPYEAAVKSIEAQLTLQEQLLENAVTLQERNVGRAMDAKERQAAVDNLRGQLENARWNLDKTTVRAPSDGFVTNVALRTGARVGGAPVMAFVETSITGLAVEIPQNNVRYIKPGQKAEIAFKISPGTIYTGKVQKVVPAISTGQVLPSGSVVTPKDIQPAPLAVVIDLDDKEFAKRLPMGATGHVAIFTEYGAVARIIRRILLRQLSILDYVNPY